MKKLKKKKKKEIWVRCVCHIYIVNLTYTTDPYHSNLSPLCMSYLYNRFHFYNRPTHTNNSGIIIRETAWLYIPP